MAFDTAIDFLTSYRENRAKALNNEQRMSWAADPTEYTVFAEGSKLSDLVEVFDSSAENTEWEELYHTEGADILKMQAVRLKIAFLAGCRRDIRTQFIAGPDQVRGIIDQDRFEFMRLSFFRQKLELLKQIIYTKSKGLEKI